MDNSPLESPRTAGYPKAGDVQRALQVTRLVVRGHAQAPRKKEKERKKKERWKEREREREGERRGRKRKKRERGLGRALVMLHTTRQPDPTTRNTQSSVNSHGPETEPPERGYEGGCKVGGPFLGGLRPTPPLSLLDRRGRQCKGRGPMTTNECSGETYAKGAL